MKLKDILEIVEGRPVYVDDPDVYEVDVHGAFGTDLMSDALANLRDADNRQLLITGLANMQIFHTANTLDLAVVLLVRGKQVDEHMLKGAKMSNVSLFVTDLSMFDACGRLFAKGLGS